MADDPFYRKLREMTSLDPEIKTGSHVPLLNRITLHLASSGRSQALQNLTVNMRDFIRRAKRHLL